MANIKGTNVASPVVPFTEQDIYPTHEAKYGKGGFRTVANLEEMNAIPEPRREEGMFVFVKDDPTGINNYQYLDGKFIRNTVGRGIPVYNNELIKAYGINPARDTYISIPDEADLDGQVEENTIKTSINGTYIDILFQSIRQLQAEVARLRNTMRFGLESYTENNTAMSTVMNDLEKAEAEEPIWAIDEHALSDISGFTFELGDSGKKELKGGTIDVAIDPVTSNSYLKIKDTATWTSNRDIRVVGDNKVYIYTTLLALGQNVKLGEVDQNGNELKAGEKIEIGLHNLNLSYFSEKNYYNVIFLISRKDGDKRGKNFIWISINDPYSDKTCAEGYYNPETRKLHDDLVELGTRFTVLSIDFSNTTLYKFKIYSKMQDFSHDVEPIAPKEEDYKYKVAHITIRSVSRQEILNQIKDQLLENELIWEETNKRLWIKSGYKLVPIGMSGGSGGGSGEGDNPGGGNTDNMTTEELIATLKNLGIVAETGAGSDYQLSLNNIADITFVHQGSGKKFKFGVTSEGNLQSSEIPNTLLANKVSLLGEKISDEDIRGFIGQLHGAEAGLAGKDSKAKDYRLAADRLKIGAFYAPFASDTIRGCSHSYVELENTSDKDIPLEGCYLHFTRPKGNTNNSQQEVIHLALTGTVKAGSTYLIRGAKHSELEDPNVYIKVRTYDQEWWNNGSLVSFEVNDRDINFLSPRTGYGFALTYGNPELTSETALIKKTSAGQVVNGVTVDTTTYPFTYDKSFIDGIYYKKVCQDDSGNGYWAKNAVVEVVNNSIYKNTFELDPAKQAFQGLTQKDSSRTRWGNVANDYQIVDLTEEYIEFPNSPYRYAVANYTPKASFERKNVSTDKTKLDKEKPNMVSCSFGIDIYTTRTFNWISLGNFDEYVWIKPSNSNTWTKKLQSYIPYQEAIVKSIIEKNNDGTNTYDVVFSVSTSGWRPGSNLSEYSVMTTPTHQKVAGGLTYEYKAEYQPEAVNFTQVYVVTLSSQPSFAVGNTIFLHKPADKLDEKKYFGADINNNVYARMTGRFPGDGSYYAAHKVIVDVVPSAVGALTKYDYVVGREGKDGNPDPEHCSEVMNFTLYPNSYKTRIYQTTDQQGFTWIEYQAWAAAAEVLNKRIQSDQSKDMIIPILINTGDMTQNGTRVNEWFDYYTGGYCLFNHLEQMNVVGNNDLCGPNPEELGTGDDSGKSNAYYFHLFYCYEVNPDVFVPLIKSLSGDQTPKYVPSLYYFQSSSDRFLAVNSEITETTCKTWYGLVTEGNQTVNAYTGYTINGHSNSYIGSFTSIYTMLYKCFENAGSTPTIVFCHEMPFTVITKDALSNTQNSRSRSISPTGTLVGSHLNQISKSEVGDNSSNTPRGIYWFTRLIENFNVKLVLGGHKHTYACTYPLRENYYYRDAAGVRTHSLAVKMPMAETLDGDSIDIYENKVDTTKLPLTKKNEEPSTPATTFYPTTCVPNLVGGIVYFMCQATGYKQTSNKELPSPDQKFSCVVSQTTSAGKADANQKYPMFGVIDVSGGTYKVKLARVTNIMAAGVFKQSSYGTGAPGIQWMIRNSNNNYGTWTNTEDSIYTIS